MPVEIRSETALPVGLDRLIVVGRGEGFRFVDRLVADWASGENRFDQRGEVFLCAYRSSALVAFGGLNRDPYSREVGDGRIRHVYVEPHCRRLGIGAKLVARLVESARSHFTRVRLTTEQAASFYERVGFLPVRETRATHALGLRDPAG